MGLAVFGDGEEQAQPKAGQNHQEDREGGAPLHLLLFLACGFFDGQPENGDEDQEGDGGGDEPGVVELEDELGHGLSA